MNVRVVYRGCSGARAWSPMLYTLLSHADHASRAAYDGANSSPSQALYRPVSSLAKAGLQHDVREVEVEPWLGERCQVQPRQ